jgi:hypothetical protein
MEVEWNRSPLKRSVGFLLVIGETKPMSILSEELHETEILSFNTGAFTLAALRSCFEPIHFSNPIQQWLCLQD